MATKEERLAERVAKREERATRRRDRAERNRLRYSVFIPGAKGSFGAKLTLDSENGTIVKGSEKRGEVRSMRDVTVTIDSGGTVNRRVTLSRTVAMGPFALFVPKKLDDRDMCVVVDGPDFQWSIQADPKYGAQVRARVSRVTTTLREWQAAHVTPPPPRRPMPTPMGGPARSLEAPTVRLGPPPRPPSPPGGRHSRPD